MDVNQHDMAHGSEPLELSFPPGMFNADESTGSQNALRMVRIIEKMIQESSAQNALLARHALLQSFPRLSEVEETRAVTIDYIPEPVPEILRLYCTALSPGAFADVFASLTDDELEVFLKNYVHAHETWGHPQGIGTLVRTMLESCTHMPLPLTVRELEGLECPIPANLISRLGREKQFSLLGKNFLLGRKVVSRPIHYDILVGPITMLTLEKFQRAGWADETRASSKLCRLAEYAEPFYLRARIHFLFEKSGFVLSKATLGRNRLGIVAGEGVN